MLVCRMNKVFFNNYSKQGSECVFISFFFFSLIELRQNVGRLLITFVPALDLEQVNYECNVIDEILEQVLNDADTK